jgi:endo-1,4-beta-D-glucanase Y
LDTFNLILILSIMPIPIFSSSFPNNSYSDYDSIQTASGESVSNRANAGVASNALTIAVNNANTNIGLRKNLPANSQARVHEFWVRVRTGANLDNGQGSIYHAWSNQNANGEIFDLKIGKSSTANRYKLSASTDFVTYSVVNGITDLKYGTLYKIIIHVSDTKIDVYLNHNRYPEITCLFSGIGKYIRSYHLGKFYNTTLATSGTVTEIDFACDSLRNYIVNPNTTNSEKALDVMKGWLQAFVSPNGAVTRLFNQVIYSLTGNNGGAGDGSEDGDIVSEGIAYALLLAVDTNDQYIFDLVETFARVKMERRTVNTNDTTIPNSSDAQTLMPSCMGWVFDPITNKMKDANLATDADMDRLAALLRAHDKWGSTGSINYQQKALVIATELRLSAFTTFQGMQYMLSDKYVGNEYNVSYLTPSVFRELKNLDNSNASFWQSALDGCYDMIQKVTSSSGLLATSAGLPPNWNSFDENTGAVSNPPSFHTKYDNLTASNQPDIYYTYDAFRTTERLYWDYLWYGEIKAKNILDKMFDFFNTEWNNGTGTIKAEYRHNGTVLGNYENAMMYAVNSFPFKSKNTSGSNTNFDSIWNNKVLPSYISGHPTGSYLAGEVNGALPNNNTKKDYYGSCWLAFSIATREGLLTNLQAQFTNPISGNASSNRTTIVASPNSISANGASTTTVTVTLYDASGNRVTSTNGVTLSISSNLGTLSPLTSQGDGTYRASLTAGNTAGQATISGILNSTPIASQATINLVQLTNSASAPLWYRTVPDKVTGKIPNNFL